MGQGGVALLCHFGEGRHQNVASVISQLLSEFVFVHSLFVAEENCSSALWALGGLVIVRASTDQGAMMKT